MRLRAQVTCVWQASSSDEDDDEDAVSDDGVWQPGSPDGSDAEDGGVAGGGRAAPAAEAADAAPRRHLNHADLTQALLKMPAAHEAPAVLPPEALTQEWALGGGLSSPTLVAYETGVAHALGMRVPPELDTDERVAAVDVVPRLLHLLPGDTPVPVIDVATQSESAPMPLADFAAYFTSDRRRQRLLNVVSLSLAGTPLEASLCAPRVVREADLVANAWPATRSDPPAVQLYALASPAGCFTDWHLDFGGSSVWYRIVAGAKVFALAPPTTHNLRAYTQWASSSRQSREFLGDALQDVHKYTVRAGELLLIPGGWPHAVYTPEDSMVVGGNFVHAANLGLQCLVWRIEDRLHVQPSYRYPNFVALCWYAAHSCCQALPAADGEDAAVAKAERAGAKRLIVKAGAGDGTGGHEGAAGLHFILSALKAEEEGTSAQPAADGDDAQSGAAAAVDSVALASELPRAADADPAATHALANAADEQATAASRALTPLEVSELVPLHAQLTKWLDEAHDDELQAGVPADVGNPRVLLARLHARLRATGLPVQQLSDRFHAQVEEITSGSTRLRFRLRKRTVIGREEAEEGGALPVPAELRDDLPAARSQRAGKVVKPAATGAVAKPAATTKPPAAKKPAVGGSVRDRLAKKLKFSARR